MGVERPGWNVGQPGWTWVNPVGLERKEEAWVGQGKMDRLGWTWGERESLGGPREALSATRKNINSFIIICNV